MRLIDADQWVEELKDCHEDNKDCNQWLINEIDSRHTVYTGDEDRTVRIVFSHEHWGSCHRCPSCGKLANIYNTYCPGCGKLILWKDPEERADMSKHEWFTLLQEQEKAKALNQKELSELFYKKLRRLHEYEKSGGWIPCSERLPETKDDVLIYWGGGNMSTAYYVSGGAGGWFFNYGYDNPESSKVPCEPKAWRPLPESYKS